MNDLSEMIDEGIVVGYKEVETGWGLGSHPFLARIFSRLGTEIIVPWSPASACSPQSTVEQEDHEEREDRHREDPVPSRRGFEVFAKRIQRDVLVRVAMH